MNNGVLRAEPEMKQYILSILAKSHPGTLSHIVGLFTRRGYSIESITTGPPEKTGIGRLTIIVACHHHIVEQMVKQCQKLVDVIHVSILNYHESVTRELALIIVNSSQETRSHIIEIAEVCGAKIDDMTNGLMMIEITGNRRQINSIIELLEPFGIETIARTGTVALPYQKGG